MISTRRLDVRRKRLERRSGQLLNGVATVAKRKARDDRKARRGRTVLKGGRMRKEDSLDWT